jgi:hypothetical protein
MLDFFNIIMAPTADLNMIFFIDKIIAEVPA